jgi:hypothetical protein
MKLKECHLLNGDILGVKQKSLFSQVTKLVQRLGGLGDASDITHVGVAHKIDGVWYSQEMDGKHNVLRPISQIIDDGLEIEVFRSGVIVPSKILLKYLTKKISYSFLNLLKVGFHLLFDFDNNGSADFDKEHCSNYVVAILRESGWRGNVYNMPSPAEVCLAMGEPIYTVTGE